MRLPQRCVDREELLVRLDLRICQRREGGRRGRGRKPERVAREAIADRAAAARLQLERGDVTADLLELLSNARDLGVERGELVPGDERLRFDDLTERLRIREQLGVTRPRGFELLR